MVEQKKTKRERDIKSKLMAAIAMLLVSSIMMVSTTYAWFTLSTAPEVTGITTSIASNGNLEIALSPRSGVGADVNDAVPGTTDWLVKNLTWGNLVDMSNTTYGLSELTLAPAQLALDGTDGNYTLGANVLATPQYGSDGRISALNTNAYIAGKTLEGTGYDQTTGEYGVRAVGRASGMSAQESKFKNSVGAITTYANAAISAASNSLSENGNALAGMLITHYAAQGETDDNNYAVHVPALKALAGDLNAAVTNIDKALRAALIAAACHIQDVETTEADEFAVAIAFLENEENDIADLVDAADQYGFTVPDNFNTILGMRDDVAELIGDAVGAANELPNIVLEEDGTYAGTEKVTWDDVSAVLEGLMNTNGDIKISGNPIADVKQAVKDLNMDFLMGLVTDCRIELGEGSGVYYDLAEITGNITAKVPEVPINIEYQSLKFNTSLKNVIIKTTVEPNTSVLPLMKNAISANAPEKPEGATNVLDSYYGYVIDLMVRTNAADSKLLLQSTPAQRVYDDSNSTATQGKGTTISFHTTVLNDVATLTTLLESINVVFFDPSHNNAVFGMAKVTSVQTTEEVGENDVVTGYTVTGSLELCAFKSVTDSEGAATGRFVAGDKLESQALCNLTQNQPQAISAMVYLDGENVTSADVLAKENVVGTLNLQFSSDADLKPMENSDLRNMGTESGT